MKYKIQKFQNPASTIERRDKVNSYVPDEKIFPIKGDDQYIFNMKYFGQPTSLQNSQVLTRGKNLTPAEQALSYKKLAIQERLQNYQEQKKKETKELERAIEIAPYVIPGIGQVMWAGKAVDLTTSEVSNGKYKSWGDMVDRETGSGEFIGDLTNPGYYAGIIGKVATPLIKKNIQRIPINYNNYKNLRDIEISRFKSFISSFNDEKALQIAANQFTNRNTFYRGVKNAENLDEATQMLTTVDGKIRPDLRHGVPEGNNSGVIYSSVNPKRAEVFAGNQGHVGIVTPAQIKGNNLTEFIDNNLIGNRKDLLFNKQFDGTPQLISFGNPQQQVMNLRGFVESSNKLPITKPLISRIYKNEI